MEELLKKQLFWTRLGVILLAVVLVIVLVGAVILAPAMVSINNITKDLEQITRRLDQADIAGIAEDLKKVSDELAQVDFALLGDNINKVAEDAQVSMEAALTALDTLDLETLNAAIADLKTIIDPLARLIGGLTGGAKA